MNIQERSNYIGIHNQLLDLAGTSLSNTRSVDDVLRYWNSISRPPINYYIPQHVFQSLYQIMNTKRLYNRPIERYKYINDLFATIGLFPLASGTNRRTFYCSYDAHIVFKLGSDNTGRSDNLNEYTMQALLKPFFAKMMYVTPDGILSMSERVETMTEEDYKITYSKYIFEIIYDLLSRGYIMEDIGSNSFKNWGVRPGYGPVIVDCPYIYKVDRRKMKCLRRDPITNEICNGEIDYNYDKGMSEIICYKCGRRYFAAELGQMFPSESNFKIVKGRDFSMGNYFNSDVKVSVSRGDKVVHRYYNETPSQPSDNNRRRDQRRRTQDNNVQNIITSNNQQYYPQQQQQIAHNINVQQPIQQQQQIQQQQIPNNQYIQQQPIYQQYQQAQIQPNMTTTAERIDNMIANQSKNIEMNLYGISIPVNIVRKINKNFGLNLPYMAEDIFAATFNGTNNAEIHILNTLTPDEQVQFRAYMDTFITKRANKQAHTKYQPIYNAVKQIDAATTYPLGYQPAVEQSNQVQQFTNRTINGISIDSNLLYIINNNLSKDISTISEKELYRYLTTDAFVNTILRNMTPELVNQYYTFSNQFLKKYQDQAIQSTVDSINRISQQPITTNQQEAFKSNNAPVMKKPEPVVVKSEALASRNVVTSVQPKPDESVDENGNTIGRIQEWDHYYREGIKYLMYPKDVKNELIYTLRRIEAKFGFDCAEAIAKKLELKYIQSEEFNKEKSQTVIKAASQTNNRYVIPKQNNTKQQQQQTQDTQQQIDTNNWKSRKNTGSHTNTNIDLTQINSPIYPEKAKTQEELDIEYQAKVEANSKSNAIYGFPGQPKVDDIRYKTEIPKLKQKIELRFNNIPRDMNPEQIINEYESSIYHYIYEDIRRIMNDSGDGLDVRLDKTVDNRNKDCYKVDVLYNDTSIIVAYLYYDENVSALNNNPSPGASSNNYAYQASTKTVKIDPGFDVNAFLRNQKDLHGFFDKHIATLDLSDVNDVEEAKVRVAGKLFAELVDYTKNNIDYTYANKLIQFYIDHVCNFSFEQQPSQQEEVNQFVTEQQQQATINQASNNNIQQVNIQTPQNIPQQVINPTNIIQSSNSSTNKATEVSVVNPINIEYRTVESQL